MTKITPTKVLFIKLGEGGKFEKDCIEKNDTLQLDYRDVDHTLCIKGDWKSVHNYFTQIEKKKPSVATSHTNQIKQFYKETAQTLWITFYANKLWWCFSKPDITLNADNTKTRQVMGKWSDRDLKHNLLTADTISGRLLRTQGFRGTICLVPEEKYAIAKINGEQMDEVVEVERALSLLKQKLSVLIKHLQWKDFETLIDLIFRQAGWQRVSEIGKTQKTLDLDLYAPVTGESALVQIKSQSGVKEFNDYQSQFEIMTNYNKFFYIVHSPSNDLLNYKIKMENTKLYFADEISDLIITSGLVEWVMKKAS
jgi:hypothetical protein